MKLNAVFLDSWLSKIPAEIRFFLIYGQEEGAIQLAVQKIQRKFINTNDSDFNLLRINMKQIKENPSYLSDEMRSISLLGERRVIVIDEVSGSPSKEVISLFKQAPGDALCILIADDLKNTSSIRKLFEECSHTVSIACYKDDVAQMSKFIREHLSNFNAKFDFDIPALLAELMPSNRLLVTQELEKLVLFAGDKKITSQEVIDCLVDGSELKFDELCDAVVKNNLKFLCEFSISSEDDEINFVMIIRIISKYIQRLIEIKSLMADGLSYEQSISKLSPPIFFKQKEKIASAANSVNLQYLQNIYKQLIQLEIQCKSGILDPNLLLKNFLTTKKK